MDVTPNLQGGISRKKVGTADVGDGGRGDAALIAPETRKQNKTSENNVLPCTDSSPFGISNAEEAETTMRITSKTFVTSDLYKIYSIDIINRTENTFQTTDDQSIEMYLYETTLRVNSEIATEACNSNLLVKSNRNVNKKLCTTGLGENVFHDKSEMHVKNFDRCHGVGEKTVFDNNAATNKTAMTFQEFVLVDSDESLNAGLACNFGKEFRAYFAHATEYSRVVEKLDVVDRSAKRGTGSICIGKLSPELLLLIFSFCNPQDLQQNVSHVCTQWHELALRPCLRRELRLYGSDPTSAEIDRKLGEYPNLRLLEVQERHDLDHILTFVAAVNHRLSTLVIKRCWNPLQYDVISEEVLKRLFETCRHLTSLTIKKCPFSGFFEVFDCAKENLRQIRKLNLNYLEGLKGPRDIQFICNFCPRLEDLRALTRPAYNTHLFYMCEDSEIRLIASRLRDTLQVLKLEGDAISDSGVEALTQCSRLRKLCLRRVRKITDIGLLQLVHLEELVSLELVDLLLPSAYGWKELFKRCVWNRMHTLLLAHCINIDDEVLRWVSSICQRIVRLCVAGCYLATSKGLKVMFKACPRIEELVLCLSQSKGCIFWIPSWVPNIKTIVYHSCYRLLPNHNVEHEYSVIQKVFRKKYPFLKIRLVENLNDLMLVS